MNNIKCKTPITILSIVSLVCSIIGCITYFVYYDYNYVSGGDSYYELTARFPSIISLLFFIVDLAPVVLIFLYIMFFHKQYKASIVFPISCGLIALYPLLSVIDYIMYDYLPTIQDIVIDLTLVVPFVLLTINALKGLNKKIYAIIAAALGTLGQIISILEIFEYADYYIEDGMYLYMFTWPVASIGLIALFATILLFALNNRIPAVISVSPKQEKKRAEKMTPEQSLRFLKDKLDLGMITEEEYQTQRAEIISKL